MPAAILTPSVILSEAKNLAFRLHGHDAGGRGQRVRAGISSPHPSPLPQGEREEEWGFSRLESLPSFLAPPCPSRETCPRYLLSGSGNPGMMPCMFMTCPPSSRPPPPFSLLCHSERREESRFPFARARRRGQGTEGPVRAFLPLTPALSRKGRGRKSGASPALNHSHHSWLPPVLPAKPVPDICYRGAGIQG